MLIIIISRSSLKLDHVGSKTRLLGHQATQVSDLGPLWPSCFKLPLSGTYFHGSKGVQAIEVLLYKDSQKVCLKKDLYLIVIIENLLLLHVL